MWHESVGRVRWLRKCFSNTPPIKLSLLYQGTGNTNEAEDAHRGFLTTPRGGGVRPRTTLTERLSFFLFRRNRSREDYVATEQAPLFSGVDKITHVVVDVALVDVPPHADVEAVIVVENVQVGMVFAQAFSLPREPVSLVTLITKVWHWTKQTRNRKERSLNIVLQTS